jgi:2,4-dienoyl-CoA reductase-like NADH-dependent reductase (Old Yellow Enzyme family)
MHSHFTNSFSKFSFSSIEIKNRIGLGPINTGLFDVNGDLTPQGHRFYNQYFENEVGLVYIGGVAISQQGRSSRQSFVLNTKSKCLGIRKLAGEAHKHGSRLVLQLMHAGRQTTSKETGVPIVACSPIPCPIVKETPEELTEAEISAICEDFKKAAILAELCQVDLIEIHAAHGYLISGFLSPYSNSRPDEFGGSIENRFRFLNRILIEITESVSIPVGIRINCEENVENGLELEDVIYALKHLIGNKISFVSLSGGVYSSTDIIMPPRSRKVLWRSFAERLKKEVPIPLFLAGNIDSLKVVEDLIESDAADICLLTRSLLADPFLITKTLNGKDIQECIDCRLCKYHSLKLSSIYCPFNPEINRLKPSEVQRITKLGKTILGRS